MSQVVVVDSAAPEPRKRRRWLWILLFLLVIAAGIGGYVIWAINPLVPIGDEAYTALEVDDTITITDRAWLAFLPQTPPTTGFIFYPGARVPAIAYAPIARQIAEAGYLAVIVYPPINLAILNPDMATPVTEQFSAVDNWVIGGHSLGGTTAALYTNRNSDLVDGLVLTGAYLTRDMLAESNLPVVSIYGTADGLTTPQEINDFRDNLPPTTTYIAIEGGNHAQFGYYGEQNGDNPATIAHDEQISQTVDAILNLLNQIDN